MKPEERKAYEMAEQKRLEVQQEMAKKAEYMKKMQQ